MTDFITLDWPTIIGAIVVIAIVLIVLRIALSLLFPLVIAAALVFALAIILFGADAAMGGNAYQQFADRYLPVLMVAISSLFAAIGRLLGSREQP